MKSSVSKDLDVMDTPFNFLQELIVKIDSFQGKGRHNAWVIGLAIIVAVCLPNLAMAAVGAGGGLPYEGWLAALRNSATGPVAFTASIIGVIGAGTTLIFQGGEVNSFLRTILY